MRDPRHIEAIQALFVSPDGLAQSTVFVLMLCRRLSAIVASAEYTSLFGALVATLAEEEDALPSAGLRPSYPGCLIWAVLSMREGHASGVQGPAGLSPLHRPVVLGLPGGVRGIWRPLSGAAARADHGGGAAAARLGLPPRRPQHRDAARRGPRLGGPGHDRRDAAAASRYASHH